MTQREKRLGLEKQTAFLLWIDCFVRTKNGLLFPISSFLTGGYDLCFKYLFVKVITLMNIFETIFF